MIRKVLGQTFDLMKWGASGALLAFFILTFQNCGSDFMMKEGLDLSSSGVTGSKLTCELDAFKASYMPFLAKCKACHVPGGSGAGAFSSTNAAVAYDAFLLATKVNAGNVDERAVNVNHAPGITGPVNQAAVDTARGQYDNAMSACNGGNDGGTDTGGGTGLNTNPAVTTSKSLNASGTQTLTFNLASELASGQTVTGATFSINVNITTPSAGKVYYQFSQPRVTTTTRGLRIASIMFKLNGVDVPLVTTYSRVDRTLATNANNTTLSTATAAFETTEGANTLAISYGILVPQ